MNVAQFPNGSYVLTAETEADRDLLDCIHIDGTQAIARIATHRTTQGPGYITTGMTLAVDRMHPQALEVQSGRQLLRAARELFRLCLGEEALHRHIGLDTPNPDSQEKITALLDKLHIVLEAGIEAVRQSERLGEKVDATHGVSNGEKAILTQPGSAA